MPGLRELRAGLADARSREVHDEVAGVTGELSARDRSVLAWLEGGKPEPGFGQPLTDSEAQIVQALDGSEAQMRTACSHFEPEPEAEFASALANRPVRRWPLFFIGLPAAVSIWSGWVGLGGMCGFGLVHPLPGIVPGFELNTAITLPVGVEAYGAYALGAWLSSTAASPARTFARRSAIGALVLGMLGQVAYHLLAAARQARAPWPVTVAVACMPVVTLGFGAALTHLLRAGVTDSQFVTGSGSLPEPVPGVPEPPAGLNGYAAAAAELFADSIAAGNVPGIRAIRSGLHLGQDKAQLVQAYLRQIAAPGGHGPLDGESGTSQSRTT